MYVTPVGFSGVMPSKASETSRLPAGTHRISATIEGVKQGKFKGENASPAQKDEIRVVKFRYEVVSPRDIATGLSTGKRQHSPVVITKQFGAATPQIFQALVTNELLKSVVIKFHQTNDKGVQELLQLITLTNAFIAQFRQVSGDNDRALEEVAFTFQKIQIENKPAKTVATDFWGAQS